MRTFVAIFAAVACMSAPALGQSTAPQVVLLHPDADDEEAIVIPVGSALRLASFPRDWASTAAFSGQFTLSGTFELSGHGDDALVTVWPESKSLAALPYWRVRGGPREIYISNAWAFAQAVVAKDELQKLEAEELPSVRGHVTIIADDYQASIECDAANFSARFVSVVKPDVEMAASAATEEGC